MTATLEKKNTPKPDGWSREPDGTLKMDQESCFRLFAAFIGGCSPAYAYVLNLVYERGMDYEGFKLKNTIVTPEVA
jgi:hypothetical protein